MRILSLLLSLVLAAPAMAQPAYQPGPGPVPAGASTVTATGGIGPYSLANWFYGLDKNGSQTIVPNTMTIGTAPFSYAPVNLGASNVGAAFYPTPPNSATNYIGTSFGMAAGAGVSGFKNTVYVAAQTGASGSSLNSLATSGLWASGDPAPGGGLNVISVSLTNNGSNVVGPASTTTGLSMTSVGSYMGGEAIFIDAANAASAWHWGEYITQGSIQPGGTGLAIGYPTANFGNALGTTTTGIDLKQFQNNSNALQIRRFTDTAPTGNMIYAVSNSGAELFRVAADGQMSNPGIVIGPNGLALPSAFTATSATAGAATALPATPLGYLQLTINGVAAKIPYYAN